MKKKTWVILGVIAAVVVVGSVAGISLWNYHEQPQFCATCHLMQPYLETWESSDYLANAHSQAGVTCLQCHEPDTQQQIGELVTYIKGDYEEPLAEREFDNEFCLTCHDGTYEDLADNTPDTLIASVGTNPHESHNGDLDCSTCHKVHRASEFYCEQCHIGTFSTPEGWE